MSEFDIEGNNQNGLKACALFRSRWRWGHPRQRFWSDVWADDGDAITEDAEPQSLTNMALPISPSQQMTRLLPQPLEKPEKTKVIQSLI